LARPSLIPQGPIPGQRRGRSAGRALLLCLLLAGCTHVAPYEREYLAKPSMDTQEREALRNKFYAHVYEAREGAMPGVEHAGGGCGCN
jgi:Domain of unknown function (DUF4266)